MKLAKKIIKHRLVSIILGASLIFVLGGSFWAYFALRNAAANGMLILHFNDIEGITQIGELTNIIFVGILGTLIVLLNSVIALELEEKDGVLGKIVAAGTFVFAVLLFIALAAILNVN